MGYEKNRMIEEYGALMPAQEATPKQEQKKGFLSGIFKPKRKILGNYEMQDLILSTSAKNSSETEFLKAAMLEEIKALTDLTNIIKKMQEEKKSESKALLKVAGKIRDSNPELANINISEIEYIIRAFIDLPNEDTAEVYEELLDKFSEEKFRENQKQPNKEVCYKCGAKLEEGEYYITEQGRKGCMYHLTEPETKLSIKEHEPNKETAAEVINRKLNKKRGVKNADKKDKLL